jgi:hypothetical protein
MLARLPTYPLLLLVTACDVDATVGYNEGTVVAGIACEADALSRCDEAVCGVTNVFDAPNGSITLVADERDLFFLSGPDTISKRSLDGGDTVELARADSALIRMAGDATHVYWTELNGQVRGVAKAGGARFDAGYVFGNPSDISVDSTHLYWVFPEFGQVAMVAKPAGEATHITGQDVPRAVASDRTHVYWVNEGSGVATGELVRAARGDLTSAEVVLSGLDAPIVVATSEPAVYFASRTALYRLSKGETVFETVTTGFTEVKGIGVYGHTVYGVGMEGLWRVPAVSGEWQQLERRPMSGMALSCSGVYATGWFESALVRYGP